jgi:hypothetical protein
MSRGSRARWGWRALRLVAVLLAVCCLVIRQRRRCRVVACRRRRSTRNSAVLVASLGDSHASQLNTYTMARRSSRNTVTLACMRTAKPKLIARATNCGVAHYTGTWMVPRIVPGARPISVQ